MHIISNLLAKTPKYTKYDVIQSVTINRNI